jgi:hypothetical protein
MELHEKPHLKMCLSIGPVLQNCVQGVYGHSNSVQRGLNSSGMDNMVFFKLGF